MRLVLLFALGALVASDLTAQEEPHPACLEPTTLPILGGGWHRQAELARLLGGPDPAHAGLLRARDLAGLNPCAATTGFALTPVMLRVVGNSAYAADRYQGGLWAGRGLGVWVSAGVGLAMGPLRVTLAPEVTYEQNRPFRMAKPPDPTLSEFAYPYSSSLDWPQRHGHGSLRRVHAGSSTLALEMWGSEIGLTSENLWLGPALRYPLLLSNAAEGFPHVYLRPTPFRVGIGTLELNLLLGRLEESAYFDDDAGNDYRSLSSISLVLRPTSGLAIGAAALRHRSSGSVPPVTDLFSFFSGPFAFVRGRDDDDNGLMSLFASWDHPASGFGVHAEWGREDFFYDLNELVTDPTHAHAWTLGLTKAGSTGQGTYLLALEATQLSNYGGWYINGDIPQGHSHRGQLLGAYVGPGSEAQFASLDLFGSVGDRWTVELERIRWDERSYRSDFLAQYGFRGHDVELRSALGHARHFGSFVLDGSIGLAVRRNRQFLDLELWTFEWKPNYEMDLTLAWLPQRP